MLAVFDEISDVFRALHAARDRFVFWHRRSVARGEGSTPRAPFSAPCAGPVRIAEPCRWTYACQTALPG